MQSFRLFLDFSGRFTGQLQAAVMMCDAAVLALHHFNPDCDVTYRIIYSQACTMGFIHCA